MVEDARQGREVVDASVAFSEGAGWGEGEKLGNSTHIFY